MKIMGKIPFVNKPVPQDDEIYHVLCEILNKHRSSFGGCSFYDEVHEAYEMYRASLHDTLTVYKGGKIS